MRLWVIWAVLCCGATHAWASELVLSRVYVSERYEKATWSGRFADFGGAAWDVSRFYEVKNRTWTAKSEWLDQMGYFGQWWVVHRVSLDSGVKTPAQSITPHFKYGLGVMRLGHQSGYVVMLDGLVQSGAKNREAICVDGFEREYHCGSGLPWSMYRPKDHFRETVSVELRYVRRF
jgi:hypothetical protein